MFLMMSHVLPPSVFFWDEWQNPLYWNKILLLYFWLCSRFFFYSIDFNPSQGIWYADSTHSFENNTTKFVPFLKDLKSYHQKKIGVLSHDSRRYDVMMPFYLPVEDRTCMLDFWHWVEICSTKVQLDQNLKWCHMRLGFMTSWRHIENSFLNMV